jgi:hypothetical protein
MTSEYLSGAVKDADLSAFRQVGLGRRFVNDGQIQSGVENSGQTSLFIENRITKRKARFHDSITRPKGSHSDILRSDHTLKVSSVNKIRRRFPAK